jgi:hypothetical protein
MSLTKLLNPLRSRKVQVAIATIVAAYAAEHGLEVSVEVVVAVIAAGVSVIVGIAIEDHGAKSGTGTEPLTLKGGWPGHRPADRNGANGK